MNNDVLKKLLNGLIINNKIKIIEMKQDKQIVFVDANCI
jgi:hypothetical protein